MNVWLVLFSMMALTYTLKSPQSASILLALSSLILGINFSYCSANWLTYSVVILFVSGMMVLFLYLCTMMSSSNFTFSLNKKEILLIVVVSWFLAWWGAPRPCFPFDLNLLFLDESLPVMGMMLTYLLLSLGAVLIFCLKMHGPLKSKHK